MRIFVTTLWLAMCQSAAAHDGHGLPGSSHWHATDSWGLVAMVAGVGAALWLSRGK